MTRVSSLDYDYVIFSLKFTHVWPTNTQGELKEFVQAVDRQGTLKTLYPGACLN